MKQRKYLTRNRPAQSKKYEGTLFTNQTSSEDHERTIISKTDDKSVCEKYLNVYESINKKEATEHGSKMQNTISRIKKVVLQPKIIFQNPVIQKSYTKLPSSQILQKDEVNLRNSEICAQENASIMRNESEKRPPSKKNQMALKLISENRRCKEKENIRPKQEKLLIEGNQLVEKQRERHTISANCHRSNQNSIHQSSTNKNPRACTPSKQAAPVSFSLWQSNNFPGSSTTKTYIGYYKSKNKKRNDLKREKEDRNSSSFMRKIDQEIDMEQYRRIVLRPGTMHGRQMSKKNTEVDFTMIAQKMNQSCEFGRQEKIVRTQSEVRLQNYQKDSSPNKDKKTNYFGLMRNPNCRNSSDVSFVFNGKLNRNFQRKNSRKYNFNNKSYVHVRNFSSNLTSQTFEGNDPLLSITTETPLTASIFVQCHQSTDHEDKENAHQQSRKLIPNTKPQTAHPGTLINSSMLNRPITRKNTQTKNEKLTLNKIQDAIQNDMQLRIMRIVPSSTGA